MRMWLRAMLTIGLLALPLGAAQAESLQDKADEAEKLAGEALSKLLRALDVMIDSVPQYAAPEVLPNGDIIIRRLNPDDDRDAPVETGDGDGVET